MQWINRPPNVLPDSAVIFVMFFFCVLLLLSAMNILWTASVKCRFSDKSGDPYLKHVGARALLKVDRVWTARGYVHAAWLLEQGQSAYVTSQGSLQSQWRNDTQFSFSEAEYELLIWDHF